MRRFLTLTAAVLAVSTAAYAGYPAKTGSTPAPSAEKTAATHHHTSSLLNNVVRINADGSRTALCCCGHEFTVTDTAPTMDHGGTMFYLCGAGCKEAAGKATAAESAKMMTEWHAKFATESLATNAVTKDGTTTALCGCGTNFTVTKATPVVVENGVKMYCCSDACHDKFAQMSGSDRLAMETKIAGQGKTAQAGM